MMLGEPSAGVDDRPTLLAGEKLPPALASPYRAFRPSPFFDVFLAVSQPEGLREGRRDPALTRGYFGASQSISNCCRILPPRRSV